MAYNLLKNYAFKDDRLKETCEFIHKNLPGFIKKESRMSPYTAFVPVTSEYQQHLEEAEKILSHSPDIIALSMYMWNRQSLLTIISFIRQIDKNVLIVIGGPETYGISTAKKLLKDNSAIDFVISGEGEIAFQQLLYYNLLT